MISTIAAVNTGCFAPPARSSGPSEAQGVELTIVSQYCEEESDPDWEDNQVVQLRMKIGVTNKSKANVEFYPDRLRVVAPNHVSPAPVAADSSVIVQPGETKVAAIRFMNRGSLKCREEMRLDPSDGLVSGAKLVPLRPIAFQAQGGS